MNRSLCIWKLPHHLALLNIKTGTATKIVQTKSIYREVSADRRQIPLPYTKSILKSHNYKITT